jgi:hypothetical protein
MMVNRKKVLGTSLFFIRSSLEKTVQSAFALVRDIADNLVTTEINLLKTRADTLAHRLMDARETAGDQGSAGCPQTRYLESGRRQ